MGSVVVDGEGVTVKKPFQKDLMMGLVKAKVARRGENVLKVSSPLPPPENFNRTPGSLFL